MKNTFEKKRWFVIIFVLSLSIAIVVIVGNVLFNSDEPVKLGGKFGIDDIGIGELGGLRHKNPYDQDLVAADELEALRDLQTLKEKYYIVDGRTEMTPELFDVEKLLSKDLKMKKNSNKPQILIFHTHSYEMYADSADESEGVIGVGERLKEILENDYGLNVIHDTQSFEPVEGEEIVGGAYERMEPKIRKILKENPSISVMIDLHRDGVPDGVRLVTEIDGKPTAKIMFYNGISKKIDDGVLADIKGLENENVEDNLAFSYNMELAANKLFPGISRGIYINAYRYSTHMRPRSLLLELGAQNNTKEEAYNAAKPIARILAEVLLE